MSQQSLGVLVEDELRVAAPLPYWPPARSADDIPFLGSEEILQALEEDEAGDAKLLARLYEDRLTFDHSERQWYLWAGHYWQPDRTEFIRSLVCDQLAAQYLGAAASERSAGADNEVVEALIKRARQLRRLYRVRNVLTLAQGEPLGITGEQWDRKPWLLACENVIVDLHTGNLADSRYPGDYIRTICPTTWTMLDRPAPRWEQFLLEVFNLDTDLIEFLQRLLGYGITGLCTEHVLPVLWGEGRNGKDTLLSTLKHVLGPLADPVSHSVLIDTGKDARSATPHLVDLQGKRLVWVSETAEGERLNTGLVKLLTGGGSVPARGLYERHIRRIEPQYLVLLVTNNKPHASADDYALWKRLLLIPFTQKFVGNPTRPDEHQHDLHLLEKLKAESGGILAWLVRGCLEWQRIGLRPPETVRAATEAYQADEDVLGRFLEEECKADPTMEAKASTLYRAYKGWVEEYGLGRPMSLTAFAKRILRRFEKRQDRRGVFYQGIGLLSDENERLL